MRGGGEDQDEDHEDEDEDHEIQDQNQDHQDKEVQDQDDGNGKNEDGEEYDTHNVNDLLKGEAEGEVDRFTVVEHRTLQAVNFVISYHIIICPQSSVLIIIIIVINHQ